jgi:hypothetical protein
MEKEAFNFTNKSEFNWQIKLIDVFVPLRNQGRKSEHTERYSIVSFLKNFINEDLFNFPFTLTHRDKPDFSIESYNEKIGIEFTESVPEQLARASSLLEKHFSGYAKLEPEFFGWDAPDRTNDEILEILSKSQKQLIGQGFNGNSVEEKWIEGIVGCLINKTTKLTRPDFEKFDKNWLLIYDNQTRIFLDREYVQMKLKPILKEYWEKDKELKFDKIFFESGKYFYQLDQNCFDVYEILIK